ncbi:MAG TPA: rod shape-determining protein MreC [Bryobacteraceae bacterium]|jgi:rod shape-determining protein MreC|nr:rod shape-determining protein MreC [Bryobacteraceae bacterium]
MDSFLSRYRNLTVLLIVIVAQLILLGYQVKTNQDMRLIRVWSVSAITPLARALEFTRFHTFGVFQDYFVLLGIRENNRRLKEEVGRLKMQNQFLQTQLSDADRGRALVAFQSRTPSKTLAARVVSNGTGSNSATVFIDRGSDSGVESGMAVVTPEGIVGKVIAAYPSASLVLLVTDPTFAAGVVSQKNHVGGTLKGQGHGNCIVDYIQNEQKVDVGEWFYTSGYDRIFPRGFPVGQVSVSRSGRDGREVYLNPAGLQGGVSEVLVVLRGAHQIIPENAPVATAIHMLPPPPETPAEAVSTGPELSTQADEIKDAYKKIGQLENHDYGISSSIPNYNVKPRPVAPPAPKPAPSTPGGVTTPGVSIAADGAAARPQTPAAQRPAVSPPQTPRETAATPRRDLSPAPPSQKPVVEAPHRARVPLLVTDPADVDPSELEAVRSGARPKPAAPKPSETKPQ